MKNLRFCLVLLLFTVGTATAQESDLPDVNWDIASTESSDFTGFEESFSLYGYMIDYFQASTDYGNQKFSTPSFGNALLLRLKGDWRPEKNLRFHLEFSYLNNVGNQNPYVIYEQMGLSSFSQSDFPLEDFNQRMFIDHAWGLVNFGNFDLQFGKFPIAWGTGYVFNPTARVSFPPFLDMVTEDTPGVPAIVPSYAISERLALQAYLAFQDRTQKSNAFREDSEAKNIPYGLKIKTIIGSYDLSLSWFREVLYNDMDYRPIDDILDETASEYVQGIVGNSLFAGMLAEGDTAGVIDLFKQGALAAMTSELPVNNNYMRSYFLGTDFAGAVGNFGVYGEFAFRIPKNSAGTRLSLTDYKIEDNLEAAIGFDYTIPGIDIETRFEYFYQGSGVKRMSDYNLLTVLSGERLVLSRNYAMLFLEKAPNDYHKFTIAFFSNLNDGSFALLPAYNYLPYNNFEFTAGAFILGGKKGSEFDGRYSIYGIKEIDLIDNIMPYLRLKLSF